MSGKASRIKKLTSHLSALSLKAFWNWTAMRAQKPERLRGGVVGGVVDEVARLGAIGAAELVVVGTGIASLAMLERGEQGARRGEVT